MSYRSLDAAHIVATADTLHRRIAERFPDAGLSRVARELHIVATETTARIGELRRPRWGIRIAAGALTLLILAGAAFAMSGLRFPVSFQHLGEFVTVLESAINDIVFVGIALAFLLTVESRLRRRQALRALHELRSIVHIVDMHQLTKDPDQFRGELAATRSSPRRTLTRAELARYLDYCSEALSLAGKVAALYAQQLDDPVVLAAVSEMETLTAHLSGKIWQKLVILGTDPGSGAVGPASAAG
jgi:hypothetical protein